MTSAISRLKALDEKYRDLYALLLRWDFWLGVGIMFVAFVGGGMYFRQEFGSGSAVLIGLGIWAGLMADTFMGQAARAVDNE